MASAYGFDSAEEFPRTDQLSQEVHTGLRIALQASDFFDARRHALCLVTKVSSCI